MANWWHCLKPRTADHEGNHWEKCAPMLPSVCAFHLKLPGRIFGSVWKSEATNSAKPFPCTSHKSLPGRCDRAVPCRMWRCTITTHAVGSEIATTAHRCVSAKAVLGCEPIELCHVPAIHVLHILQLREKRVETLLLFWRRLLLPRAA